MQVAGVSRHFIALGHQWQVVRWVHGTGDVGPGSHRVNSLLVRHMMSQGFRSDLTLDMDLQRTPMPVMESPTAVSVVDYKDTPEYHAYIDDSTQQSEGYFRLGYVCTLPVPKFVLRAFKTDFNVNMRMTFMLDSKWSNGSYLAPEDVKVNFYGFGEVKQYQFSPWRKIKDNIYGSFLLNALTQISETYPLPHIVLDFKVETIGVPLGTEVLQDYDIIVSWDIAGFSSIYRWIPGPEVGGEWENLGARSVSDSCGTRECESPGFEII